MNKFRFILHPSSFILSIGWCLTLPVLSVAAYFTGYGDFVPAVGHLSLWAV